MWNGDLFFSGPQYGRRMTPCENGLLFELQIFNRDALLRLVHYSSSFCKNSKICVPFGGDLIIKECFGIYLDLKSKSNKFLMSKGIVVILLS